jgi:hypothetical protein
MRLAVVSESHQKCKNGAVSEKLTDARREGVFVQLCWVGVHVKYRVISTKFIWAPVYLRALLVSQDKRHLFVNPLGGSESVDRVQRHSVNPIGLVMSLHKPATL